MLRECQLAAGRNFCGLTDCAVRGAANAERIRQDAARSGMSTSELKPVAKPRIREAKPARSCSYDWNGGRRGDEVLN